MAEKNSKIITGTIALVLAAAFGGSYLNDKYREEHKQPEDNTELNVVTEPAPKSAELEDNTL